MATRLWLVASSNRLANSGVVYRAPVQSRQLVPAAAVFTGLALTYYSRLLVDNNRTLCEEKLDGAPPKASREAVSRVHSSVVGNYENRLKFFAAPEKVFEYYASIECSDGSLAMTFSDFMQSILPYTFQELYYEMDPTKHLRTLTLFDLNGDGFLQFDEFLILSAIITTPYTKIEELFYHTSKEEGSTEGELTRAGFVKLLTNMVKASPRGSKWASAGALPDPRKVSDNRPLEDIVEGSVLVSRLFPKGTTVLTIERIQRLIENITEEVLYYEFTSHGDVEGEGPRATISAREFAGLLVGLVHPRQMEAVAKRAREIDWEGMRRVCFGGVKEFDRCLNGIIEKAKEGNTRINREEFCGTMVELMDKKAASKEEMIAVVDVLFKLLDKDGNGVLDQHEFFGLLRQRSERWVQPPQLIITIMNFLHTLLK